MNTILDYSTLGSNSKLTNRTFTTDCSPSLTTKDNNLHYCDDENEKWRRPTDHCSS